MRAYINPKYFVVKYGHHERCWSNRKATQNFGTDAYREPVDEKNSMEMGM
jgi:hypothetical protein